MDGEIWQFLIEIAPSLGVILPKLAKKLEGKKDEELWQTMNLSLLAALVQQNSEMISGIQTNYHELKHLEGKVQDCDEAIGILLKRSRNKPKEY